MFLRIKSKNILSIFDKRMERVKDFCEKIESGDYSVIVDFFADPNITTESGRKEAKKLLKDVAELILRK